MELGAGIVLAATLVAFVIVSVVLSHHWNRYEVDAKRRRRVRIIYYSGAAGIWAFIIGAFLFLI